MVLIESRTKHEITKQTIRQSSPSIIHFSVVPVVASRLGVVAGCRLAGLVCVQRHDVHDVIHAGSRDAIGQP